MRLSWVAIACFACIVGFGRAQAPPAPSATDAPVPVDPKTMHPPVPFATPEAEFSDLARQNGYSGACGFSLVVDTSGYPQNVNLVRCSNPAFAHNADAAVRKYRFKPATMLDGKPIAVIIHIIVNFSLEGGQTHPRVRMGLFIDSPPGIPDTTPDAAGIYPLLNTMEAPRLVTLRANAFEFLALWLPINASCDVLTTLDAKARVAEAQVQRCDDKSMEKAALETVKSSKFSPELKDGKPVPVRMMVQLVFRGFEPEPRH